MNALVPCRCSDSSCPLMVCSACGVPDCKWPGECKGLCVECGGQNPFAEWRDDGCPPSSCCSEACNQALWDRGVAEGRIVAFADLTPEQVNEEFKKIGLALDGVGERKPS